MPRAEPVTPALPRTWSLPEPSGRLGLARELLGEVPPVATALRSRG